MQYLSVDAIREKFLAFFEARGHLRMPSFPLVPQNDNSLLLINSGMAPLKPYFTGQELPPHNRVVTCQKCIRTVDIDEVGTDERHGSFFEMLGNFSFGDYFKAEAIPWAWAFLVEVMDIPPERLYVSVYEEDDDAYDIWRHSVGLPPERILRMGKADNFWEHGVGPCGPDSEIYYDRGPGRGCGKPDCAVGCDCDRFMEVWNLVFTQYNKREDGGYDPLSTRNIDTGMGLERLAIVMQDADHIFDIDNIKGIIAGVRAIIGVEGPDDADTALSLRIMADHARSVTFMAADGVLPANEGRGYVLRRLLRRAVRHGRLLGKNDAFLADVAQAVIDTHGAAYPELAEKADHIRRIISIEENRFLETLETGLALLKDRIADLQAKGESVLSGADAFKLYDTYGFPLELTREILSDGGLTLDEPGFTAEMEAQRLRARSARGESTYMGAQETVYHRLEPGLPTLFVGYEQPAADARILALIADGAVAECAREGQEVSVFLSQTPFYAASGGQLSDSGTLETADVLVEIRDCVKVAGLNTAHRGVVRRGCLRTGDTVRAAIDEANRLDTARNHTATHLLQKALRDVLGAHVEQAGSEVSGARLRFDFTHFAPMTPEERSLTEDRVNRYMAEGPAVTVTEMPIAEARKKGATALFGEKYGETVRVVDIGGVSIELCGGTHLTNAQTALPFKLLSESGVAAGVRRIEALTGPKALAYYREAVSVLQETAGILKTTPEQVPERAKALLAEHKQLQRELNRAKTETVGQSEAGRVEALLKDAGECGGVRLLAAMLNDCDANGLRRLGDKLRDKLDAFILCGVNGGTVQFMAWACDAAVRKGFNAGQLVKEAAALCGGGGGGRPGHAQAGGKDASLAEEALAAAKALMIKQING